MTKRECAIVSAYTGILCGNFSDFHEYVEEILNRPVWTHEFADTELWKKIKELSKEDFCNLGKKNKDSKELYMKGKEVDLGSSDGKFDTIYINVKDWNEIQKKLKALEIIKKHKLLNYVLKNKKCADMYHLNEEDIILLKEVIL